MPVENAGDARLEIKRVRGSCKCFTEVSVDTSEIAPGERATITVVTDTKGRRGKLKKYIYIESNDAGNDKVSYDYDAFGRLKQYTDVWGKQINVDSYDASGKILAWRYPGYSSPENDPIVYAYDDIGRLYKITDKMPAGDDKVTEIDYDQDTGAMVKVTLPNDTVTTLEYDDLGRLTALVNAKSLGGETITSYVYSYRNDGVHSGFGQVERITHEDGRFDTFAYDEHERLTTEHYKTPQDGTLFRFDYAYDDDGNRTEKKYDYDSQTGTTKVVWFSDETDRTTIDTEFGPSNQLARMWTQGTNTTGTKHTVCGSFEEDNIDTIEVVSKTTGDTQVDSATAQIRDGLFIARALNFYDGSNLATKATATATDLAENTVNTTNTGIDLDTSIDVWYEYDAAGRREYKYEAGEYDNGDPFTHYHWNDAGYLEQVDIDYGTGATPRCARAWLTRDPTGELVKLEIRTGSSLGSLNPGSGGTLVYLTKWTYFGGSVIVEREEVGTASEKEYVSLAGAYLYQIDSASTYWYYHYDGNASVAAITGACGDISALYEYDSFGNKLTNAGTVDNAFGFYGGMLLERLELIYPRTFQLLDPETGGLVMSDARDASKRGMGALVAVGFVSAGLLLSATTRRRGRRFARAGMLGGIILGIVGVVVGVVRYSASAGVPTGPGTRYPKKGHGGEEVAYIYVRRRAGGPANNRRYAILYNPTLPGPGGQRTPAPSCKDPNWNPTLYDWETQDFGGWQGHPGRTTKRTEPGKDLFKLGGDTFIEAYVARNKGKGHTCQHGTHSSVDCDCLTKEQIWECIEGFAKAVNVDPNCMRIYRGGLGPELKGNRYDCQSFVWEVEKLCCMKHWKGLRREKCFSTYPKREERHRENEAQFRGQYIGNQ